jgi:hypothetical protein
VPRLLLAVALRSVRWNALLAAVAGAVVGLFFGVALSFGDDSGWIALGLPLVLASWGLAGGVVAGLVHGAALLPVVVRSPRNPLPYVRLVSTLTSIALVVVVQRVLWVVTPLAIPYVLVTPFLASRGYEAWARAAAAESAARRSGASSGSRTSGASSGTRRATSE